MEEPRGGEDSFLERVRAAANAAEPEPGPSGTPGSRALDPSIERAPSEADPAISAPRWQSSLAGGVIAGLAGVLTSGVLILGAALLRLTPGEATDFATFRERVMTPGVLGISIGAAQLGIGLATLIMAVRSPTPWRKRLSLARPTGGFGLVPMIVITGFGVHMLGALFMSALQSMGWLPPLGEDRLAMARAVAEIPSAWIVPGFVIFAVLPGLFEEGLFRGFVLTGLLARWPVRWAVMTSAAMFAIFHLDVAFFVLVMPLGLWLGYVAWRSCSIVPGMICHAILNATMFTAALLTARAGSFEAPPPPTPIVWVALLVWAALVAPLLLVTVQLLDKRARSIRTPASAPTAM
jgi:membrane protease YdiL (CAAX protease family)